MFIIYGHPFFNLIMKANHKFPDQGINGLLTVECPFNGGVSLLRVGKNQEKIHVDYREEMTGKVRQAAINPNQEFRGQKYWPIKLWNLNHLPSASAASMRELGFKLGEDQEKNQILTAIAALHDMAHDWAGSQGANKFTWKFVSNQFTATCSPEWVDGKMQFKIQYETAK